MPNLNPTFYIVDFALPLSPSGGGQGEEAIIQINSRVQVANPKSSLGQALNPPRDKITP